MKLQLVKATTSEPVYVFIQDSSATTGVGLTGLVYNSGSLVASYVRPLAARVAIALATQTVTGAYSSGGFVEVDATNMPGLYRLDLPDAVLATGVDSVVVMLKGATNMAPLTLEIQLTGVDLNDASPKTGYALSATGLDSIASTATGMVEIAKAIWDRVLSGGTHNIATSAGRRLRGIQEFQGYEEGAIWVDTVNGSAGTTNYENGTVENPVNSMTDANTLAASLGISSFHIASGSTITLAAAQNNQTFWGHNWTLVLNGQDIAGSTFIGALVSGVAAGTGTTQTFENCDMDACSHIDGTHMRTCGLTGTQTAVNSGGNYYYSRCYSKIAGTGSVTFDFGAGLNASNLNVRGHSGGWTIENMGAGTGTYNATFEGDGQIIWAASCSATSNASVRGHWKITDNAGGAVTVTEDDITANVIALQTDLDNATDGLGALKALIDALNDLSAAQVNTEVDAALVDAGQVLQVTTIATLASQTSFTLTAGPADDGAYVGCLAVITDASTAAQKAIGRISAYTGASKTITLREDPGVFTMATTDNISIVVAKDDIGIAGAGLTDLGSMSTGMKAEIESEANDALVAQKLDHLVAVADSDDPVDNSIMAKLATKAATADWSDFDNTTDSQEAIRDKQTDIKADTTKMVAGIINGTVDTVTNTHTPTITEFQADNITEATADHFIGRIVTFLTGALTGQSTDITDYVAVGGIAQFTCTAMTEAPANNDTFKIT